MNPTFPSAALTPFPFDPFVSPFKPSFSRPNRKDPFLPIRGAKAHNAMDEEEHVRVEVRGDLVQEERLGRLHVHVSKKWTVRDVLEHACERAKHKTDVKMQVRGNQRETHAKDEQETKEADREQRKTKVVYQGTLLQEEMVLGEQLADAEPDKVHVLYVFQKKGEGTQDEQGQKGKNREDDVKQIQENAEQEAREKTKDVKSAEERPSRDEVFPVLLHPLLSNPILEEAYEAALTAVLKACEGNAIPEGRTGTGNRQEATRPREADPRYVEYANVGPHLFPAPPQDYAIRQDPGVYQQGTQRRQGAEGRRHPPEGGERGAVPPGEHGPRQRAPRQFRIRFQIRLDVWLLLKLASMVFVLNQGGSPPRLVVLSTIAAFVYVAQTGGFDRFRGMFLPFWNSFLRSISNRVGRANGTQLGLLQRAVLELKVFFLGLLSSLVPGWNFHPQPPVHAPDEQEQQPGRPHQE